jgi:hypothetical protein
MSFYNSNTFHSSYTFQQSESRQTSADYRTSHQLAGLNHNNGIRSCHNWQFTLWTKNYEDQKMHFYSSYQQQSTHLNCFQEFHEVFFQHWGFMPSETQFEISWLWWVQALWVTSLILPFLTYQKIQQLQHPTHGHNTLVSKLNCLHL